MRSSKTPSPTSFQSPRSPAFNRSILATTRVRVTGSRRPFNQSVSGTSPAIVWYSLTSTSTIVAQRLQNDKSVALLLRANQSAAKYNAHSELPAAAVGRRLQLRYVTKDSHQSFFVGRISRGSIGPGLTQSRRLSVTAFGHRFYGRLSTGCEPNAGVKR